MYATTTQVMDKGVVHDGKLGYATFKLSTLQPEETTRITLFLRPALNTDKFPASHNHGIGTIDIEVRNIRRQIRIGVKCWALEAQSLGVFFVFC